jgi:hypothetical protein
MITFAVSLISGADAELSFSTLGWGACALTGDTNLTFFLDVLGLASEEPELSRELSFTEDNGSLFGGFGTGGAFLAGLSMLDPLEFVPYGDVGDFLGESGSVVMENPSNFPTRPWVTSAV